jgi:hypothetical protein
MAFRSYEAFEEDDEKANVKVRFGNPAQIANWKDLKPGLDYTKLDDRGIIREGEYVDENTVIVGAYMMSTLVGNITDASTTPQVWTRGRVEKVVVMVNNLGLRLVKIRVVQDRIPELGDKFCLTDDHEVLTTDGWINIKDITTDHKVLQRNRITGEGEWVNPKETFVFDVYDNIDRLYNFTSKTRKLIVTADHRLWTDKGFIKAKDVYSNPIIMGDEKTQEEFKLETIFMKDCKVYCISVPSEVFLVRFKHKEPVWTGNSNRHGQKGTIGALLRGHDMPRTESGIVPDMIMNPHAIPSRMTIAQNLEQLLGKAAALSGGIGDGTSFMNDGSPQEAIGGILEELGFEKYGNEVMYNGATGEQIQAAIFIGPVYGMRLKHMVEDKWQARGKGRKEIRTHQPTGGRGAQGGLKIGEMDRDAIIAHGGMAFVRESFMDRSDGTKIPICVSCGTIPIYNPKLNIAICPLCDGPVKFAGDNVNNLEILPPLGRPKSKIVEVEMPYSTKLLTQEQETFLNLTMRYITSSSVTRLNPIEYSGKSSEVIKELPRLILPETVVPAYIEDVPKATLTVEQLRSMGASVTNLTEAERRALDTVLEETPEGEMYVENQQIAAEELPPIQQNTENPPPEVQVMSGGLPPPSLSNIVAIEGQGEQGQMQQHGQGEGIINGPSVPGTGPVITVRTDPEAMMMDGLAPPQLGGMGGRQIRRMPFRGFSNNIGGSMEPMTARYTPSDQQQTSSSAHVPIRITKLE